MNINKIIFILLGLVVFLHSDNISRELSDVFLNPNLKNTVYHVDYHLLPMDSVNANIIVRNATAYIGGVLNGSLVVLDGDVVIDASAKIYGHVISYGGTIKLESGAHIIGNLIERKMPLRNFERSKKRRNMDKYWRSEKKEVNLYINEISEDLDLAYNKVDGFLPSFLFTPDFYSNNSFGLTGKIGYSFYREKFQGELGVQRWFHDYEKSRLLYLGLKVRSESFSVDDWKISKHENTISALLSGFDYFNYAHRKGFEAYFGFSNALSEIQLGYQSDIISNLHAKSNMWSLIDANESMMIENRTGLYQGMNRNLYIKFKVLTPSENYFRSEYELKGYAETSFSGLKSHYSYDYFRVQSNLKWRLTESEMLVLYSALGSSRGSLPEYLKFYIGGPGSLEGITTASISGNKMILMGTEYVIRSDFLPAVDLGENIYYGIFMKVGTAWNQPNNSKWLDGFGDQTWRSMTKTSGVSLKYAETSSLLQLDVAWNLEQSRNNPVFMVRYITDF